MLRFINVSAFNRIVLSKASVPVSFLRGKLVVCRCCRPAFIVPRPACVGAMVAV